jgi:hypothetical protein
MAKTGKWFHGVDMTKTPTTPLSSTNSTHENIGGLAGPNHGLFYLLFVNTFVEFGLFFIYEK